MPTAPMAIHGGRPWRRGRAGHGHGVDRGRHVTIFVTDSTAGPELPEEFAAWERLSDEAWSMIDWGDGEIARDAG